MNLPDSLTRLASIFPVPLYVVGGAVRDFLLGYELGDFDIASAMSPAAVIDFISRLAPDFKIDPTSKKLGTLKISNGADDFEYTCFRKDSYGQDGKHLPEEVEFVDSVETDSFRRDFTINSIYYDIKSGDFIDYTGGVEDLKNKIIRAVRNPDLVLNEDALRILRMVRFACTFGFSIEESTYQSAINNVSNLAQIAPERIKDEFNKIIVADTLHGIKNAHVQGVKMLTEINAMQYIIPELLSGIGVEQKAEFHKYDVYNHILSVFEVAPEKIRLAALFHDIAKPIQKESTGHMAGHDYTGSKIAEERLKALKYSNKEIAFVKSLVLNHMYDLNCETKENKLRIFIRRNEDILDDLIALKIADRIGGGVKKEESESASRMRSLLEEMRKAKVPFSVKDLPVSGQDLINLNVPPKFRSLAFEALLDRGSYDYSVHERDAALKFLANYLKTIKE